MIPHYVILASLFLGAIQGGYPALWLADHLHLSRLEAIGVYLIGWIIGTTLSFVELEIGRRLLKRKR